MCLALIARDAHPEAALIIAANRDEFHARASEPAHRWTSPEGVLAGRDAVAGGTWLGVTRSARFALVTNFHEPGRSRDDAPSRGDLPVGFLAGDDAAQEHATALRPVAPRYNGFNLLLGDPGSAVCLSNRDPEPLRRIASGGVHGLGNRLLDSAEPKLDTARTRFTGLLDRPLAELEPALLELLADRATHGPDEASPEHPWRDALSAIFVAAPGYGTRCSTLFIVSRDGMAHFVERRFDADGQVAGETRERWTAEEPAR